MKPLLFLDVDGVVLPLGNDVPPGYEPARAGPFPVYVSPALKAGLPELLKSFEIIWATSWGNDANHEVAPLVNLPNLAFLPVERHGQKLDLVREHAAGRPFAWAEDRLDPEAIRWAEGHTAPTLLLAPLSSLGLTSEDLDRLHAFAAGLEGPAARDSA